MGIHPVSHVSVLQKVADESAHFSYIHLVSSFFFNPSHVVDNKIEVGAYHKPIWAIIGELANKILHLQSRLLLSQHVNLEKQ